MVVTIRVPFYKDPTQSSKTIIAEYDADAGVTVIDTNCDIVTLGIAAEVLSKQYEAELNKYDHVLQDEITTKIREAINGQD